MKKYLLVILIVVVCFTRFPQRFDVITSDPLNPFKRHCSWSIGGAYVDAQPLQIVAGNQTDWPLNSKFIKGNSIQLKSKSSLSSNETNDIGKSIWTFPRMDEGGVHAILNAETQTRYQISVSDITGNRVFYREYDAEDQTEVYLQFETCNLLYLVSVNNGMKFENLKASCVT